MAEVDPLDRKTRMAHFNVCKEFMMRTNIVLDDSLVKEAFLLSGVKTKKDLISLALKEFVMTRKRRNLLELAGKIEFRDDYDYKASRENK